MPGLASGFQVRRVRDRRETTGDDGRRRGPTGSAFFTRDEKADETRSAANRYGEHTSLLRTSGGVRIDRGALFRPLAHGRPVPAPSPAADARPPPFKQSATINSRQPTAPRPVCASPESRCKSRRLIVPERRVFHLPSIYFRRAASSGPCQSGPSFHTYL